MLAKYPIMRPKKVNPPPSPFPICLEYNICTFYTYPVKIHIENFEKEKEKKNKRKKKKKQEKQKNKKQRKM